MEVCRARFGEISDQFHVHGSMAAYLTLPLAAKSKPLRRGLYAEQFEAWLALFPRPRLLVLTSELLYKQPAAATESVLAFLGVVSPPGFSFSFKATPS